MEPLRTNLSLSAKSNTRAVEKQIKRMNVEDRTRKKECLQDTRKLRMKDKGCEEQMHCQNSKTRSDGEQKGQMGRRA